MTSPQQRRSAAYQSAEDIRLERTRDLREGGSEFGGVGGTPQPYPHEMTASEKLHALYAMDTQDTTTQLDLEE